MGRGAARGEAAHHVLQRQDGTVRPCRRPLALPVTLRARPLALPVTPRARPLAAPVTPAAFQTSWVLSPFPTPGALFPSPRIL